MPTIDLTSRFVNEPLFISAKLADALKSSAPKSFKLEISEEALVESDLAMMGLGSDKERKPYKFDSGLAFINVHDTLIHGYNFSGWGYTGYDYIKSRLEYARKDPDVKHIALMVDSGGGEVSGSFDTANLIAEVVKEKPVTAILNEHAYSAAYLLASSSSEIIVAKSGGAGSIGVVTMHVDMSEALDKWGYKIEFIYAGSHKVDGNPYEKLKPEVRNRIQARIDEKYTMFVDHVAQARGLSADAVRATEAAMFSADEALNNGLVDRIDYAREAIQSIIEGLNSKSTPVGGFNMSTKKDETTSSSSQPATDEAKFTQSQVDEASAQASTKAKADERTRLMAVVDHENYANCKELANTLLATDLSAEQIIAAMEASPKSKADSTQTSEQANAFQTAMENTSNPEVGADSDNADDQGESNVLLRDLGAATGMTYKQVN